jgi:hypothetical protein
MTTSSTRVVFRSVPLRRFLRLPHPQLIRDVTREAIVIGPIQLVLNREVVLLELHDCCAMESLLRRLAAAQELLQSRRLPTIRVVVIAGEVRPV